MLNRRLWLALAIAVGVAITGPPALAQDKSIVVASTTSTQDSGLFGHILPLFKARTRIDVKVVALGTGQALDTARRGDADFVLVGPKLDPGGAGKAKDIAEALRIIREKELPFVSRGDRSGTHVAELRL